ncbi:MAG: B12-binding domain-containing radical SAM protein [Acidobacteriota bacterium]
MRALLVNPQFPESYWSGRHALPFAGRHSLLPPLGLITVAALLPQDWEIRLVDTEVEALTDQHLQWADLAMITGMLVQKPSIRKILQNCRRLGIRTVVGGPYATSSPQELDDADHLVLGEGEETIPRFAADVAARRASRVYHEGNKPDLTCAPVPRYDLLRSGAYHQMSLQFSRGCPFLCEFCDIIVMYGRRPRTKTGPQIVSELEAIRRTGFAGDIFFVDDNFIGNKKAVRTVLPEIAAWRKQNGSRFEFYTEASINLADDLPLVDMMTEAGFTSVFIGIETPSPESLKETRKIQNLKRDMADQVHSIMRRGLDVWAGFILGFDNDGPDIFDRMIEFIHRAAIPYAMIGILGALPNTPLFKRLKQEGRLRPEFRGDQFGLTNVITRLPAEQMVAGYRRVLESLYNPDAFFRRCRRNLARWTPVPGGARRLLVQDLRAAWRAMKTQGFLGPYRGAYWSFLQWVIRHHPAKLGRAIAQAAAGHHYITYTQEVVVPTLRDQARVLAEEVRAPLAPSDLASVEG